LATLLLAAILPADKGKEGDPHNFPRRRRPSSKPNISDTITRVVIKTVYSEAKRAIGGSARAFLE